MSYFEKKEKKKEKEELIKMDKALIVTSVASMILQFNLDNIAILQKLGYEVEVGCNFLEGNTCSKQEVLRLRKFLKEQSVTCHQIPFARNILDVKKNYKAYQKIKKLLQKKEYHILHCQSPIGGVLGRLAGKFAGYTKKTEKKATRSFRIIYTAHGFHFYKGAPLQNWLFFYPVEWLCSWWTDILITMNEEDKQFAKKYLHARKVVYVPGIGIDTDSFYHVGNNEEIRIRTRQSLGIEKEDILLLSVGELSKRKNHQVIIEAMALPEIRQVSKKFCTKRMATGHINYKIAGLGEFKMELKEQIQRLGIENRVELLGFRTDIKELLAAADIFVFPSLQEGLPVALMEAMATGTYCVVSDIRGNRDLVQVAWTGQEPQTTRQRVVMVKGNKPEDWCKGLIQIVERVKEERSIRESKKLREKEKRRSETGEDTEEEKKIERMDRTGNERNEERWKQYKRVKQWFDREEVRKVMRQVYGGKSSFSSFQSGRS